jgi:zinc transport system ATP-binding protein
MNKLVEIKNLTINLGGRNIIEKINLDIKQADYIGLLGPNGAGKTTLVKAILGLVQISKGKITKKPNLNLGYVPQKLIADYEFFPTTVKEIIQLGAEEFNVQKYEKIIEFNKLKDYENELFTNLSGGLKQRVIIARTLINNVDLLILDEPTTGVDPKQQKVFYEVLSELNSQGVAVIIISHDIEVVAKQVKSIICLNQTILSNCPIEELVETDLQKIYGHNHHLIHHHH